MKLPKYFCFSISILIINVAANHVLGTAKIEQNETVKEVAKRGRFPGLKDMKLLRWFFHPTENNIPFYIRDLGTILKGGKTALIRNSEFEKGSKSGNLLCSGCSIFVNVLMFYARTGLPQFVISELLSKLCLIVLYKNLEVCRGLFYPAIEHIGFIVKKKPNVRGEDLCKLALGYMSCGAFEGEEWSVNLNSNRKRSPKMLPEVLAKANQEIKKTGAKSTQLKVLHLADTHYDPDYVEGSNAVCEAPLCCNPDSGKPPWYLPQNAAGKWGDYRDCDSPKILLENMFQNIMAQHPDIDYIMCTGDIIPHHVWRVTKKSNIETIEAYFDMIKEHFPGIPFFGAIGNHEGAPVNSFPPPSDSEIPAKYVNDWLYKVFNDFWNDVTGQTLASQVKKTGYYSALISPGFRILSLNTNFCYSYNWWVLYDSSDPGKVLEWLVEQLELAETNGEVVHLIGHVPPLYEDCYDKWSHEFTRVVAKYKNVIKGQFYGHSHLDEFRVEYNPDNGYEAVGVEYITPNNGQYTYLNPSYRIFYVDETTKEVSDFETWVMDLAKANASPNDDPVWYKLYSAKDDYGLGDLSPQSWHDFVQRLKTDDSLFDKFYRNLNQDTDAALKTPCNNDCKRKILCGLVQGNALIAVSC